MTSGQGITETWGYVAYETTVAAEMICWSLNIWNAIHAERNSSLQTFCGRLSQMISTTQLMYVFDMITLIQITSLAAGYICGGRHHKGLHTSLLPHLSPQVFIKIRSCL